MSSSNDPSSQPKLSSALAATDDPRDNRGRACRGPACLGKFYPWECFDLKADGRNGRNPICKKCISIQKKKRRQTLRKLSKTPEKFLSIIVGRPEIDIELEVGEIIGKSIVTLLEQGYLK